MRLTQLEVAREEDRQKLLIGPLTKLQMTFHYQQHFFIFQ